MPEDASKAGNAKADVAQRWGGRVPIVIGATGHRQFKPDATENLPPRSKRNAAS